MPCKGVVSIKKKKLQRQIVRRIVMGPRSMFTGATVADEVESTGLKPWGLILHENFPLENVATFLEDAGLSDQADAIHTGVMKRDAPADLSDGAMWLSPKFVDFGADEALALMKKVFGIYIYTYIYVCVCVLNVHMLSSDRLGLGLEGACLQVRVMSRGTHARLQAGFRYLPDDSSLALNLQTCRS